MAAVHDRHTMERMRAQLARADRELRTAEHFLDPGSAEGAEMDLIRAAAPSTSRTSTIGASSCWSRATKTKASSLATSTPGASLAGYALPRTTSAAGRIERER